MQGHCSPLGNVQSPWKWSLAQALRNGMWDLLLHALLPRSHVGDPSGVNIHLIAYMKDDLFHVWKQIATEIARQEDLWSNYENKYYGPRSVSSQMWYFRIIQRVLICEAAGMKKCPILVQYKNKLQVFEYLKNSSPFCIFMLPPPGWYTFALMLGWIVLTFYSSSFDPTHHSYHIDNLWLCNWTHYWFWICLISTSQLYTNRAEHI